jgi:hypothetical protein
LFIDPRGLTGRRQSWLIAHFQRNLTKPDKVGGIVANNTLRAEFLYNNLAIATNVIARFGSRLRTRSMPLRPIMRN